MSTSLVELLTSENLPAALRLDFAAALHLAKAEKAQSTRRAYQSDFRLFSTWCDGKGVLPLPAASETVAAFLAFEATAGIKPSTISRRVAAIRYAHKLANMETPTDAEAVKAVVRGIRRTYGGAKVKKCPAVSTKMLAMVATAPDNLTGLRDRALLLLGFAGAFRRSELVALDFPDVLESAEGLRVVIRRSKTDQDAEGATIAIPRGDVACPVKAVRDWLEAADIQEGPIFRAINKAGTIYDRRLSDRSVAHIVKHYADRAGFDADTFSGHSLRSGFLTSAASNGASIFKMADQSRHKSMDTLRGYVRDAELFKSHAGAGLL